MRRLVVVLGLSLAAVPALAEPYLAVREGAPCSLCHVNRSGGGKRTDYGVVYSQTVLPTFQRGRWPWSRGESGAEGPATGLATGNLNRFLAVGFDLRTTNITSFGREKHNSFDIREANLYLTATLGDRVTLAVDETLAPGGAEPREAYALVRGPWGTYVRAGLVLLPFGLRIWDDDAFTRQVTGFNYATPDLGVELGCERRPFHAQVAVSNGTIGALDNNLFKQVSGITQLIYPRFRVGLSGTYNRQPDASRVAGGLFFGLRLGRLALLGEVDYLRDDLQRAGVKVNSIVALGEANLLVTRGLNLKLVYEYYDPFLDVREDQKTRLRVALDWFVMPMVHLTLSYLHAAAPPQDQVGNTKVLAAELHVYF